MRKGTGSFLLPAIFALIVYCEDVQLPHGDKIAIETLQKLQKAHDVAANQKMQEDLFLSLPLSAPNQTDSVTVTNSTVKAAPKVRRQKVESDSELSIELERRAIDCDGELWQEGQDPCEGREDEPGFRACYQPCMFTQQWFINNANNRPALDECVFYTAGLSDTAASYVDRRNAAAHSTWKTIWHIWDRDTWMRYDDRAIDNPMRCVIQSDIFEGRRNMIRQGYFERMSDTMAYMCGGTIALMDRNIRRGRTGRVKQAGIWNRVEFPRLKMDAQQKWQGRLANRVDAIGENDPNNADTQVWWARWWVRGGPDWPNEATKPMRKRFLEVDVDVNDTLVDLKNRGLTKRAFDISVFDEGGKMQIDW